MTTRTTEDEKEDEDESINEKDSLNLSPSSKLSYLTFLELEEAEKLSALNYQAFLTSQQQKKEEEERLRANRARLYIPLLMCRTVQGT